MKPFFSLLGICSLLTLSACSSDDSTNTYDSSYVQFYNAAANSKSTVLTLIDGDAETQLGSAVYGDAISSYEAEPGTYEYQLSYTDDDGEDIVLSTQSITLKKSEKTLVMLSGDYTNPVITPITFAREDIDDMKVIVTNITSKTYPLEVLLVETGADLDGVDAIGSIAANEVVVSALMPTEDYTLYVRNADTGDLIFESESMALDYSIEYMLVIKDSYGPSDSKLSVDVISNATTVNNYDDLDALAQFRVYNAEPDADNLSVIADGKSPITFDDVDGNAVTEFVDVQFGDYQVQLMDDNGQMLAANKLLTLNQNDTKTLVFYKDDTGDFNALSFAQAVLPSSYQHEFTIVNLVDEFDSVQVYFIQDDETIETTTEYVTNIAFAKSKQHLLSASHITILLVNENELGQKTLLARLDDVNLEDKANMLLVANEAPVSIGGYQLTLVK